jgi:NCS2 family nucleobase:cation symporter-2
MYAGAVAVPLIIGRALKLSPEQVAMLISADLFCCGIVTLIQSLGLTQWFGIRLPVMMGVTFAAVGPMVAMASNNPGVAGAQAIFGAIIGAGAISIFLAPVISRMLRFFPPVVTGTVITVIGISLMRVGINWIFGNPFGPTAPSIVNPEHAQWLKDVGVAATSAASTVPPVPKGLSLSPSVPNPAYAPLFNVGMSALVLVVILMVTRFATGFFRNIAVLIGIVAGSLLAAALGVMNFDKVSKASWFEVVMPFQFGMPIFDPILIMTMVLVMIVVMIESTGMFLALGDLTERKVSQPDLARGLRVDGLGTFIGGIFNTFPYTSFSQNVGLVGVTGVRSRFVCVAAGVILIVMGLLPKLSALVEAVPTFVLGGAGLVMFGMVAATGIRILAAVDYTKNRNNLFVVAISIGFGMIPLVAPNFKQWMPHGLHPLIESGILLASIAAVLLNAFFNGVKSDADAAVEAAATTHGSE